MRYYLENSNTLMPGGHDNEDTDEEEESDWLEEAEFRNGARWYMIQ